MAEELNMHFSSVSTQEDTSSLYVRDRVGPLKIELDH